MPSEALDVDVGQLIGPGSVMNAMSRMSPPQFGHSMSAARRTDAIADRATMNDSGSKTLEQGLKPAHK